MIKFLKKVDPAWIILVVVSIIGLSIYWCYFLEPRMFSKTFSPLIFAEKSGEHVLVEYNDVIMELDHLDANVVGYFHVWDVKLPTVITDKENRQHLTIQHQELTIEVYSNGDDSLLLTIDKGYIPVSWKLKGYGNFDKVLLRLYEQTGNEHFIN